MISGVFHGGTPVLVIAEDHLKNCAWEIVSQYIPIVGVIFNHIYPGINEYRCGAPKSRKAVQQLIYIHGGRSTFFAMSTGG
jgi:hypothetical protein